MRSAIGIAVLDIARTVGASDGFYRPQLGPSIPGLTLEPGHALTYACAGTRLGMRRYRVTGLEALGQEVWFETRMKKVLPAIHQRMASTMRTP